MYTISPLEEKDIGQVAQIRYESRQALPEGSDQGYRKTQTLEKKTKSTEKTLQKQEDEEVECLKYIENGHIGGIVITHFDPPELGAIYVDPNHQGKGIGRILFERHVAELSKRGVTEFFLRALRDNTASRGFYEKMGCIYTGEEKKHEKGEHLCFIVKYIYTINDIN